MGQGWITEKEPRKKEQGDMGQIPSIWGNWIIFREGLLSVDLRCLIW